MNATKCKGGQTNFVNKIPTQHSKVPLNAYNTLTLFSYKQQSRRSSCAPMQYGQHLCYSLDGKCNIKTCCYMQTIVFYPVSAAMQANLKDRFSTLFHSSQCFICYLTLFRQMVLSIKLYSTESGWSIVIRGHWY